MAKKKMTPTPGRNTKDSSWLEIELPLLSDEAAAAMADVFVQLYHRFEATYYAQILSHHADLALNIDLTRPGPSDLDSSTDPF
jgi:hypothetical protein